MPFLFTAVSKKFVFLPVGFLVSAVEVQPSINPAVAGGTVIFSLSPSMSLKTGSWALGETLILNWVGNQQAVFPGYNGRASVNVTTGALTLSSLKLSDSGVYLVQSNDVVLNANASITVIGEISQGIFNVENPITIVHLLRTSLCTIYKRRKLM